MQGRNDFLNRVHGDDYSRFDPENSLYSEWRRGWLDASYLFANPRPTLKRGAYVVINSTRPDGTYKNGLVLAIVRTLPTTANPDGIPMVLVTTGEFPYYFVHSAEDVFQTNELLLSYSEPVDLHDMTANGTEQPQHEGAAQERISVER